MFLKAHDSACIDLNLMLAWKRLSTPAIIVSSMGGHWSNSIAHCAMVLFTLIVWSVVIQKPCENENVLVKKGMPFDIKTLH